MVWMFVSHHLGRRRTRRNCLTIELLCHGQPSRFLPVASMIAPVVSSKRLRQFGYQRSPYREI
ncbi:hypothetical protein HanHA89_Chr05g0198291 [Helianthus annuus]|nr:hypothetical protein HanHA89_Chr05g0198291 [Helianthus annuus]